MATMGQVLLQTLARSAEAILRHEGSAEGTPNAWQTLTQDQLARRLYDARVIGSPFTYIQYRNVAGQVIRNVRDAETMMQNPGMTILDVGRSPGVGGQLPQYEYRSVLVARDQYGNELSSRIVYTYSSEPLSANEVEQEVLALHGSNIVPQGYPDSRYPEEQQAVSYDVYVVSAGGR